MGWAHRAGTGRTYADITMSLTPIATDPLPAPPASPAFSLSATIELAKGIMSRGFTVLILCSLALLVAQVPPQVLAMAQVISAEADREEAASTAVSRSASAAGSRSAGAGASDGAGEESAEGGFRGALREALMSDGPDPSARTVALGFVSNCFSLVWAFLVQLPLAVGAFLITIRLARGESPGVQDILHGYRRLPAQWGAVILQYLASMPLYAMAAGLILLSTVLFVFPQTLNETVPSVKVGAALVGMLLLVPALPIFAIATWIAIRLTFCVLAAVDPAMGGRGPVAAVGTAWRVSRGHVLELIVLFMLVFVITLVTAMCCLVPLFVIGLPAVFALLGAAWLLLMRRECPGAPELIARGPDGSWGLPSQRVPGFDPSANAPPDFRA